MHRLIAALLIFLLAGPATATEAGWALLREGGHVVLLRNAFTPAGGGALPADGAACTQRDGLSERGRQQARKIGALFAARAERTERVLASRYCNALETARIAFGDRLAEPVESLDLTKGDEAAMETQIAAIKAEIQGFSGAGNMVLVTHGENIRALTGASPREGEAVIVRADGDRLHILGRIIFN